MRLLALAGEHTPPMIRVLRVELFKPLVGSLDKASCFALVYRRRPDILRFLQPRAVHRKVELGLSDPVRGDRLCVHLVLCPALVQNVCYLQVVSLYRSIDSRC